jgi:hypothetical protein
MQSIRGYLLLLIRRMLSFVEHLRQGQLVRLVESYCWVALSGIFTAGGRGDINYTTRGINIHPSRSRGKSRGNVTFTAQPLCPERLASSTPPP